MQTFKTNNAFFNLTIGHTTRVFRAKYTYKARLSIDMFILLVRFIYFSVLKKKIKNFPLNILRHNSKQKVK